MNLRRIVLWIIALLPLGVTAVLLPSMADRVPAHYGMDGMVDRYDSKYMMLIFPLIILVVVIVRDLLPRWTSPDDAVQQANIRVMDQMILPLVIVLSALNMLTLWLSYFDVQNIYATPIKVPQLILAGLSILFVVIGNVLPKTKPNWYVGIRVPWTINHPEVWYKTHRFGGVVMTLWGVLGLGIALFVQDPMVSALAMIIGTLVMITVILIYSLIEYRQMRQRGNHE